jgi:hypothetical protein
VTATTHADVYEFRIRGRLDDDGARRLAAFHGTLEPSETVLRGRVTDQAELQGTLARLQEQGLELLEVKRITGRR